MSRPDASGSGRTRPEDYDSASGLLVAALADERGWRLAGLHHQRVEPPAGLHHHRVELAAAPTLSRQLGRQLHDRLGGRSHGLIGLGSKLGFGKRWSPTPFPHAPATLPRAARPVVP